MDMKGLYKLLSAGPLVSDVGQHLLSTYCVPGVVLDDL